MRPGEIPLGLTGEVSIGCATTWAGLVLDDRELPPAVKYLCLAIAQYTSSMGRMEWPSKDRLAEQTGMPILKVENALKAARESGYLKWIKAYDGGMYIPSFPIGRGYISANHLGNDKDDDRVTFRVSPEKALEINKLLFGDDPLIKQAIVSFVKA